MPRRLLTPNQFGTCRGIMRKIAISEPRKVLKKGLQIMDFQFFTRLSAVRHESAWTVSVGFLAPLVPITEAPRTARLGASCENPQRFTTFASGLSPIRVPP